MNSLTSDIYYNSSLLLLQRQSKVLVVEMKYGMWRFTMVNDYAFNAFNAKRYWTAVKAATQ